MDYSSLDLKQQLRFSTLLQPDAWDALWTVAVLLLANLLFYF